MDKPTKTTPPYKRDNQGRIRLTNGLYVSTGELQRVDYYSNKAWREGFFYSLAIVFFLAVIILEVVFLC